MKPLLFIALLLTAFMPEKSLKSSGAVICILTSDKPSYKIGELPKFTVEIFNNSKDDIYLVGSLDGSDIKWRFPYCYYSIEKPKPATKKLGRCGNMNTLSVEDFRLVKAGEKFNPHEGFFDDYAALNTETFKNPGIYKLKYHYSTNSQNISDFMGDKPHHRDEADSIMLNVLFRKVPKVEISSNEIEIIIEE